MEVPPSDFLTPMQPLPSCGKIWQIPNTFVESTFNCTITVYTMTEYPGLADLLEKNCEDHTTLQHDGQVPGSCQKG